MNPIFDVPPLDRTLDEALAKPSTGCPDVLDCIMDHSGLLFQGTQPDLYRCDTLECAGIHVEHNSKTGDFLIGSIGLSTLYQP